MAVNKPRLYLMVDDSPEFELTDKLPYLEFLGIDVDTPVLANTYQDGSSRDGSLFNLATIQKKTVNVRLALNFTTYDDLKSKTYSINKFFYKKKIFRFRTSAEPMLVQFCRPVGFEIKQIADGANDCFITIPFENPSGYKFSRFDSLNQADLWDDYNFNWDIPIMEKEDFHFFNLKDFRVLNPSGIPIDPYLEHHDLKIKFKWTGSHITVENRTNGTSFTYNGQSNNNEIIVLNGCEFFDNGTQVNVNSDFGYLKLEPGWNDIRVSGCDSYDIKFEFPFIYV